MAIPHYKDNFINFPNEIYYCYKHRTEVVKLEKRGVMFLNRTLGVAWFKPPLFFLSCLNFVVFLTSLKTYKVYAENRCL